MDNSQKINYEELIRNILYNLTGNSQFYNIKSTVSITKYGYDSIMFVNVIVKLEEVLGIEFPNELMLINKGNTIEKLCNLIKCIN